MPQISLPCPHCHSEKIGFAPRGAWPLKAGSRIGLLFLQCEGCGEGLIAKMAEVNQASHWMNNQTASPGEISQTYPKAIASQAPPDVPPRVAGAYLSGIENLKRNGGANAAAIMFRRTIEIALKTMPLPPSGHNLQARIDNLPADVATPAMKQWAHKIRLDGNDAAHEPEDFSDEDAKKLQVFAEMFLTYAFTLPEMLKRASGEATSLSQGVST